MRSLEDRMESRLNDLVKQNMTIIDKIKANDAFLRSVENDVRLMTLETKNVYNVVTEARDASN